MGGIQAGLIIALRIPESRDIEWPMILMAVLSAALLAAGVLCHYWDIWVHRTVRGISFIFVGIDAAGDVFSLVSIFFQPKIDALGIVIYATEFVLWCGVFACGGYYNFLPWAKKRWSGRSKTTPAVDEAQPSDASGGQDQGNGITLHDMPSSSSVFRTVSANSNLRVRRGAQGVE
jgi:hypothetical protein